MESGQQKSCWGLTAKAVMAFAAVLFITWLVSGTQTAAVIASSG